MNDLRKGSNDDFWIYVSSPHRATERSWKDELSILKYVSPPQKIAEQFMKVPLSIFEDMSRESGRLLNHSRRGPLLIFDEMPCLCGELLNGSRRGPLSIFGRYSAVAKGRKQEENQKRSEIKAITSASLPISARNPWMENGGFYWRQMVAPNY